MKLKKKLQAIIKKREVKRASKNLQQEMALNNIKCDNYTVADFIDIPSLDIFTKAEAFSQYTHDLYNRRYYTSCIILLGPAKNRIKILDRYTGQVKDMIMLGSNNFLGLSYHPEVVKAGHDALKKYGGGAGSYVLNACYDIHRKLEEKISEIKGTEATILFSSGYAANLGTISALVRSHDVAISDRLSHASIIDGCQLAKGGVQVFRHNDMDHLEQVLKNCKGKYDGKLIVVDGCYSMDGDLADLPNIIRLAQTYGARVLVDDAFGTGIFGQNGHGSLEHFGVKGKADIVVSTFTKSLGNWGAAVSSSKHVVSYLRWFARSTFFSAVPSPLCCSMVYKALEILERDSEMRERLWDNRNYFHENLVSLGFNTGYSVSPIIPIIVGNTPKLREMSKILYDSGVHIPPQFYPVVAEEAVRLRCCIMATHTKEDLDEALGIIEKAGKKIGLI